MDWGWPVDSELVQAAALIIAELDGLIVCGDRYDLTGLAKALASGRIAATDPGAPELPEEPSRWRSRRSEPLTAEGLLADVADHIDALNGRSTAAQRCWDAIRAYQETPTTPLREALRVAYREVPPHQRIFMLGDMDNQDRPLRILATDIGEAVDGDGPVATAELHQWALDYFDRVSDGVAREAEQRAVRHADDPEEVGRAVVTSHEMGRPASWPNVPGLPVLRNDYQVPVTYGGETYPSVLHGYWALSAADAADHDLIRDAATADAAHDLGGRAARRADWATLRLSVMAGLLRAKFTSYPELAEVLLSTGDARISYTGFSEAPFWRDSCNRQGRNWMGRLLELIRSELSADRPLREPMPAAHG
ncbi:NADAR family protein [Yinghuangia sp. ASG 101]|uniref:NADAR family protein n=1 Tax=Yinghuangia sp. ASG 101 TaxID=2896848 RepID=UPI001E4B8C83|nr:NADAR family protein [Yinghuangia sp. ASG 101]UGQ11960.1 NADAR family protein [Yinghuangia sp. ASG 101]